LIEGGKVMTALAYVRRMNRTAAATLRASKSDMERRASGPGASQGGADIRGGEEKTFTAGVSWRRNPVARLMLDYRHVRIDRPSPANSATAARTIGFTPAGAQIGRTFDAWSLRTPFAF
jgi:phosphate-selective porin